MCIRDSVGTDGLTQGRKFRRQIVEFGELIMAEVRRPTGGRLGKLEVRFVKACYLGLNGVSHAYLVGLEDGTVVEANSIKRKPEGERWNADFIKNIKGLPWKPKGPEELEVDTPLREIENPVEVEVKPIDRRLSAFKITKQALNKFGYTEGCPGCRHAQGTPEPGEHTAECRRRVEEAMMAESTHSDSETRGVDRRRYS